MFLVVLIVPSGIETNFWVQTVVQATRVLIVPSGIETYVQTKDSDT